MCGAEARGAAALDVTMVGKAYHVSVAVHPVPDGEAMQKERAVISRPPPTFAPARFAYCATAGRPQSTINNPN
jgi:hypothetical protein